MLGKDVCQVLLHCLMMGGCGAAYVLRHWRWERHSDDDTATCWGDAFGNHGLHAFIEAGEPGPLFAIGKRGIVRDSRAVGGVQQIDKAGVRNP